MRTVKALLAAALISVPVLGLHTPALAQQETRIVQGETLDTETRSRTTNRLLLEALLERRAEVARLARPGESNRAALLFLDKQIAELRNRIEK